MAFDPARLYQQLLNTGLQNKDNPLYQLIRELIGDLSKLTALLGGVGSVGGGSSGSLAGQSYVTVNNDTALLPNSRQAIAGTGIILDTSIPGQIRISTATGAGGAWDVLTDGDLINPEIIFADGKVIMLNTPG